MFAHIGQEEFFPYAYEFIEKLRFVCELPDAREPACIIYFSFLFFLTLSSLSSLSPLSPKSFTLERWNSNIKCNLSTWMDLQNLLYTVRSDQATPRMATLLADAWWWGRGQGNLQQSVRLPGTPCGPPRHSGGKLQAPTKTDRDRGWRHGFESFKESAREAEKGNWWRGSRSRTPSKSKNKKKSSKR